MPKLSEKDWQSFGGDGVGMASSLHNSSEPEQGEVVTSADSSNFAVQLIDLRQSQGP